MTWKRDEFSVAGRMLIHDLAHVTSASRSFQIRQQGHVTCRVTGAPGYIPNPLLPGLQTYSLNTVCHS